MSADRTRFECAIVPALRPAQRRRQSSIFMRLDTRSWCPQPLDMALGVRRVQEMPQQILRRRGAQHRVDIDTIFEQRLHTGKVHFVLDHQARWPSRRPAREAPHRSSSRSRVVCSTLCWRSGSLRITSRAAPTAHGCGAAAEIQTRECASDNPITSVVEARIRHRTRLLNCP